MFFGTILYVMFECVIFMFMAVIRHPIVSAFFFLCLYALHSCSVAYNWGALDAYNAMRANEVTIREWSDRPESCIRSEDGSVACHYDPFGDVVFDASGRVQQITFMRLHGEEFNLNEQFFKRVTGMMSIRYREPDFASLSELRWNVPGTGVIKVTSDDNMNVDKVTISAL